MGLTGKCPGRGHRHLPGYDRWTCSGAAWGSFGTPWTPREKNRSRQQPDQQGRKGHIVVVEGAERGKGMGAVVDQILSGTAGGTGRMKNGGGSGNATGSEAGWKGGLPGMVIQMLESKQKDDHYQAANAI